MSDQDFAIWFNGLGLKHFTASEISPYFRRNRNTFPPRELWDNIVRPFQIVDMLRSYFGKSITITSSYRSPAYNKGVGGVKSSYHMRFMALDIQSSVSPQRLYNRLKKWRDAGVFKGGLKKYNTFVHIDTRGFNTTW